MTDASQEPATQVNKQFPQVIFALGPPGVGKGTICKRLAQNFGWYHLSVGDYLRELDNSTAALSKAQCGNMPPEDLLSHLKANKLVPGKTIADIVEYKVRSVQEQGFNKILIDGYPREKESAKLFDQTFGRPIKIVRFGCVKATAKARFTDRKRGTDNDEIFERRYAEFVENNRII